MQNSFICKQLNGFKYSDPIEIILLIIWLHTVK